MRLGHYPHPVPLPMGEGTPSTGTPSSPMGRGQGEGLCACVDIGQRSAGALETEWLRQVRPLPRNSCPLLPPLCAASSFTAPTACKSRPGLKPWRACFRKGSGRTPKSSVFTTADLAADPGRIAVELSTGSLFGGTKIVWLTSCPLKAQAPLAAIAGTPLEGAYLVVQAPDMKKGHKLLTAFEAAPHLAAIASYGEDEQSLAAAIRQRAQAAGYEIAADAAALIAVRCDFSALLAQSETEKLMTYAGQTRRIALEDVEACLADQQTAGLSEIVDSALNGEGRKALLAFERFMAAEQNVTPVLVVLGQALLRLHAVRAAADAGTPLAQAIKELRPPVFFKQQDVLAAQARRWTAAALSAQIARLTPCSGDAPPPRARRGHRRGLPHRYRQGGPRRPLSEHSWLAQRMPSSLSWVESGLAIGIRLWQLDLQPRTPIRTS